MVDLAAIDHHEFVTFFQPIRRFFWVRYGSESVKQPPADSSSAIFTEL